MSLTSYRAAPPRGGVVCSRRRTGSRGAREAGRPGGDLLSRALRRSTMGAGAFHGRVRDGIGCRRPAMATRSSSLPRARPCWAACGGRWFWSRPCGRRMRVLVCVACGGASIRHGSLLRMTRSSRPRLAPGRDWCDRADRAIRTGQLSASRRLHTRPIDVVVFHGPQGDLVSRWVSRLDAFSGYPVRT